MYDKGGMHGKDRQGWRSMMKLPSGLGVYSLPPVLGLLYGRLGSQGFVGRMRLLPLVSCLRCVMLLC